MSENFYIKTVIKYTLLCKIARNFFFLNIFLYKYNLYNIGVKLSFQKNIILS